MASRKPILVIAGVGNAGGTGAATARVFAKAGYSVALLARNAHHLQTAADDIKSSGGDAAPFPVTQWGYKDIHNAFDAIKKHWPEEEIRVAVWNTAHGVWKPFLDVSEEDVQETVQTNIVAAFAFAREAILVFKDLPRLAGQRIDIHNRGRKKHGLKALAQSLNKEFGKQNIHVSQAIIDGIILTDRLKDRRTGDSAFLENEDARLNPESIAKVYLYLAQQDRSAWTFELELRPAHEKW